MARVPKEITRRWAQRHDACPEQVELFTKEWPDGAELTRDNLLRAADLGLDVDWLAEEILGDRYWDELWERLHEHHARYCNGLLTVRRYRTYHRHAARVLADVLGLDEKAKP